MAILPRRERAAKDNSSKPQCCRCANDSSLSRYDGHLLERPRRQLEEAAVEEDGVVEGRIERGQGKDGGDGVGGGDRLIRALVELHPGDDLRQTLVESG